MKRKSAFTLIELMVVISIIAILAALSVPNFAAALRKGRDARRRSDVSNLQQALVLYRADFGRYPESELVWENELHPADSSLPSYIGQWPKTIKGVNYTYRCTNTVGSSTTGGGRCITFLVCSDELEFKQGSKTTGNYKNDGGEYEPCDPELASDKELCHYFCLTNP